MKKVLLIGSVTFGYFGSNKTVETLTNVPPESIVIKRYTNTNTGYRRLRLCLSGF